MSSEAEIAQLVELGPLVAAYKYYMVCLVALVVYDYFLTLEDEIRYAWKTDNVPFFVMFLFIRYFPLTYQVWLVITLLDPGYTPEICAKTGFITILCNSIILMPCQIVLILRVYAITLKNKLIACILFTISAIQLILGTYMVIWAVLNPLPATPTLPLFQACTPNIRRYLSAVQIILSLTFELLVFVLVLLQVRFIKSRGEGANGQGILDKINKDAGEYFAFITVYGIFSVVMFLAAGPAIGGIPIMGSSMFMPIMICRMIMSLRKTAAMKQTYTCGDFLSCMQIGDSHSTRSVDNIRLAEFKRSQVQQPPGGSDPQL